MEVLSNWLARLTVNQVLRSWGFESLYFHKKMVSGSARSGRLPVTQYKQEGSNPFGTA